MKPITCHEYLTFLNSFGLKIDDATGGQSMGAESVSVSRLGDFYALTVDAQEPILFFDGDLFLKTIMATETSLNVKLFV